MLRRALTLVSLFLLAAAAEAKVVDRVAAVIDREVITLSEVDQMTELRFFARAANQSDDDYRHAVLEELISEMLRDRDVERFGAQEIPSDAIDKRIREIQQRFASPAEFDAAVAHSELKPDELRALINRQLQVEAYIRERFSPMIFIATEEIETYYNGAWSQQRRARGQRIPPINEVREELRTQLKATRLQEEVDKWTDQLRARANVDVLTSH